VAEALTGRMSFLSPGHQCQSTERNKAQTPSSGLALSFLMPMTHAPETGTRTLASVSGTSVMQSGAEFLRRQILESNRTVFYFATESGNHVIKILSCDWSLFNFIVVFCLIWKFWFHGGI